MPITPAALNTALAVDPARLVRTLYPDRPCVRLGDEIRIGRKGSLSLRTDGAWFDHESGIGGDPLELIRHALDVSFPDALQWAVGFTGGCADLPPAPPPKPRHREPDRSVTALRQFADAVPPRATTVQSYFTARGIPWLPELEDGEVIRFHPACPFTLTSGATIHLPAMIALMRDVRTDEPRAIHRTALKPDGIGKAELPDGTNPKKMLGPAKGCAVKLTPDADVTMGLAICEGIETGLSLMAHGICPVWPCGSAGAIRDFPVLGGIEALTVYADHDANAAGRNAALACAGRWRMEGRECRVWQPTSPDSDWNDALQQGRVCHV